MFETLSMTLGLDIGPRAVSVWLGLALGIAFGALAFLTRFCLRRALVGPAPERAPARGVWALALAVAILGTQIAVAAGWVDFAAHRFHAASLPPGPDRGRRSPVRGGGPCWRGAASPA